MAGGSLRPGTPRWHAEKAREWREAMRRPESFKARLWRLADALPGRFAPVSPRKPSR